MVYCCLAVPISKILKFESQRALFINSNYLFITFKEFAFKMPLNWIIVNKFGLEKWGEVAFLQKASSSLMPKNMHFVKGVD